MLRLPPLSKVKIYLKIIGLHVLFATMFVLKWLVFKPLKVVINRLPDELPIGSAFGTKIILHPTFLLTMWIFGSVGWDLYDHSLYGILRGELMLVMVFGIVVVHEFGHIFAGRHYGFNTPRIVLTPLGGMAEMNVMERLMTPRQEFFITIAGPLVNAVFFVVSFYLVPGEWARHPYLSLRGMCFGFVVVNLLMLAFNLLPVFPMDGGRILRSLLATRFNYLKATRMTCTAACCLAPILMVWGWKEGHAMVLVIMPLMCLISWAEVKRVKKILAISRSEPINVTATAVSE